MSKEIFKEEKVFIQHDIENKQLKEENWQLRKEESEKLRKKSEKLRKENEQLRSNNVAKNVKIKELIDKVLKKIRVRQIIILIGLTKKSLKIF